MLTYLSSGATALIAIQTIFAGGVVLASLELLKTSKSYSPSSMLSWQVLRTERSWTSSKYTDFIFNHLFTEAAFRMVLVFRALTASSILVLPFGSLLESLSLSIVFILSLCLSLRSAYGLDGADQMCLVLGGALMLGSFAPHNTVVETAVLWFISAQACLAYTTAGLAKLFSPIWRSGDAIRGVMMTDGYGNRALATQLVRSHAWRQLFTWAVILPECLFVLAVLSGYPWVIPFVLWGILFHFANALLMGLNTFLFFFLASYPAIVFSAFSAQRFWTVV